MHSLFETVDTISEWSGRIVSFVIYIGIVILFIEVFLRYLFNHPTVWAHGYSQRVFGSYFILIGAYTLLHNGHVRVDLIYNLFSEKGKVLLDMVNYIALLIWDVVLLKEGYRFFMISFAAREADEMVLCHPVYPVKFLILVGALLIGLQGLSMFLKSLFTILKRDN
jgi:TRAP-type mannitol/chloroaromatic compound transport system permease small subunit